MNKTWSSIIIYCEKIRQKLYILPRVNKSVWADIGAASTSSTNMLCYDVRSTNILVLLVLAAPIGEDKQTFYNFKNFADFLNVCSAIGANWFAAPIYWRSTRRIKMFAAPRLFG
jgi:hypothetical protein